MTAKQPEAGEYWQHKHTEKRYYIIGYRPGGTVVVENNDGCLETFFVEWIQQHCEHLPECDSFDWRHGPYPHFYEPLSPSMAYTRRDSETTATIVKKDGEELPDSWYSTTHEGRKRISEAEALARVKPVEVFPQYWTAVNDTAFAYCLRFAADEYRMIKLDGSSGPDCPWFPDSIRDRKQLTKEQAEALLVPPVESPDDWVEITDPEHVLRFGIDQFVLKGNEYGDWKEYLPLSKCAKYYVRDFRDVRCLRKDLPPLPSPKRIPVRLWLADDDDPSWGYEIAACAEKPNRTHSPYEWRELKSDGNGGLFFEREVQS